MIKPINDCVRDIASVLHKHNASIAGSGVDKDGNAVFAVIIPGAGFHKFAAISGNAINTADFEFFPAIVISTRESTEPQPTEIDQSIGEMEPPDDDPTCGLVGPKLVRGVQLTNPPSNRRKNSKP